MSLAIVPDPWTYHRRLEHTSPDGDRAVSGSAAIMAASEPVETISELFTIAIIGVLGVGVGVGVGDCAWVKAQVARPTRMDVICFFIWFSCLLWNCGNQIRGACAVVYDK
jgi:hypothetical protein